MSLCHCVNLYLWPTSLSKGSYALQLLVAGLCWQDQHRWVGAAQLIAVLVHQIWCQPSLSKKSGSDGIRMGFSRILNGYFTEENGAFSVKFKGTIGNILSNETNCLLTPHPAAQNLLTEPRI